MPGWGLTVLLPQAVGIRRAREMSITGNFVDAPTALAWGLVNHVVAHDELLPFARQLAADVAGVPSDGVRRMLQTYAETADVTLAEGWEIEGQVSRELARRRPRQRRGRSPPPGHRRPRPHPALSGSAPGSASLAHGQRAPRRGRSRATQCGEGRDDGCGGPRSRSAAPSRTPGPNGQCPNPRGAPAPDGQPPTPGVTGTRRAAMPLGCASTVRATTRPQGCNRRPNGQTTPGVRQHPTGNHPPLRVDRHPTGGHTRRACANTRRAATDPWGERHPTVRSTRGEGTQRAPRAASAAPCHRV